MNVYFHWNMEMDHRSCRLSVWICCAVELLKSKFSSGSKCKQKKNPSLNVWPIRLAARPFHEQSINSFFVAFFFLPFLKYQKLLWNFQFHQHKLNFMDLLLFRQISWFYCSFSSFAVFAHQLEYLSHKWVVSNSNLSLQWFKKKFPIKCYCI